MDNYYNTTCEAIARKWENEDNGPFLFDFLSKSDEELAEFLATVTSDVICGSSWDYDEWIKELQSEAE